MSNEETAKITPKKAKGTPAQAAQVPPANGNVRKMPKPSYKNIIKV